MEIQKRKRIKYTMKSILKATLLLLFVTTISFIQAQKKPFYNEEEEVIEAAYKNLDYNMKEGIIKAWAEKTQPKGSYTLELTIKHKGEVVTVGTIDRKGGDIPTQNSLKNFMKNYRFPFKMPKERSFKFNYEFQF